MKSFNMDQGAGKPDMPKSLYSSGEFARLNGVNKRTLHYYHEIGLFHPAVIGENGYHSGKPDMPKSLYSSGEFARLNGVNKRTLHYYHEIGLFHPAVIGENGYHYYTCFQSVELELIRMLGKLGVPLETIKSYREHPSHTSFSQIAMHQKQLIDHSMEQLMAARAFLQKKSDKLELGMKARHGSVELVSLPAQPILLSSPISGRYDEKDFSTAAEFSLRKLELGMKARHGSVELVSLPAQPILLSSPISGRYDEKDFSTAAEFSLRLRSIFGLFDSFGSRMCLESGKGEHCFFAYGSENSSEQDEIRPAGTYIRAFCIGTWDKLEEVYETIHDFCIGTWDKLEEVYETIHDFAKSRQLKLSPYSYEEGLNEMALEKAEDYVTMITIGCKR